MVCVSKIMFRHEGEESGRGFFSFFFNNILAKSEKARSLHGLYLLFSKSRAMLNLKHIFFSLLQSGERCVLSFILTVVTEK